MSEEFVMRELEVQITQELTIALSSGLQEPLDDADAGWRDPSANEAYAARLVALRAGVEAVAAVEAGATAAPAVAPPAGIEPATNRLEGDCSIR